VHCARANGAEIALNRQLLSDTCALIGSISTTDSFDVVVNCFYNVFIRSAPLPVATGEGVGVFQLTSDITILELLERVPIEYWPTPRSAQCIHPFCQCGGSGDAHLRFHTQIDQDNIGYSAPAICTAGLLGFRVQVMAMEGPRFTCPFLDCGRPFINYSEVTDHIISGHHSGDSKLMECMGPFWAAIFQWKITKGEWPLISEMFGVLPGGLHITPLDEATSFTIGWKVW
jgi:hypothetical protein